MKIEIRAGETGKIRDLSQVKGRTQEIQEAIDAAAIAGGGTVVLEPGLHVTTTPSRNSIIFTPRTRRTFP